MYNSRHITDFHAGGLLIHCWAISIILSHHNKVGFNVIHRSSGFSGYATFFKSHKGDMFHNMYHFHIKVILRWLLQNHQQRKLTCDAIDRNFDVFARCIAIAKICHQLLRVSNLSLQSVLKQNSITDILSSTFHFRVTINWSFQSYTTQFLSVSQE